MNIMKKHYILLCRAHTYDTKKRSLYKPAPPPTPHPPSPPFVAAPLIIPEKLEFDTGSSNKKGV